LFAYEVERSVLQKNEETLYRLIQSYNGLDLVKTRRLEDKDSTLLRQEDFQYNALNRLVDYQCTGSDVWLPAADNYGRQLRHQQFTFDEYDNLAQVLTLFQDAGKNTATFTYSPKDPTQLIRITNTHADYPSSVDLIYNANGCLTKDEQGRVLQYDSMNRLTKVLTADQQVLSEYCAGDPINRIDPSSRLSIFGLELDLRTLLLGGMSLLTGIATAVALAVLLLAGASLAVLVGTGIAAGVGSDVATGAVYDWDSIGTDALAGAIGGVVGEGIGWGFAAAAKAGMRRLSRTIEQLLEGAAKLRRASGRSPRAASFKFGSGERVEQLVDLQKRRRVLEARLTPEEQFHNREWLGLHNRIAEIERRPEWTFHLTRTEYKMPRREDYAAY
jgi:hypothetical protein